LSIPNLITLGRILLVPVVIWAITAGEMSVALALFLLAGISDAVDGFLAKRFGMRTELGGYLDPLADKAMLVSIFTRRGHRGGAALARHPRRLSRHHDRGSGDLWRGCTGRYR
jgi:phosphatidylglycerophosphate synthase